MTTVEAASRPENGRPLGSGVPSRVPQPEAEQADAAHDPLIRLDFTSRFESEGLRVLWAFLHDEK
jgi:hypothetical protein